MTDIATGDNLQEKILRLEEQILQLPQVDVPMMHWIEGDTYYRAILVRKGITITGARHRFPHECICIGDILVSTDIGVTRLQGYTRLWAEGGKKRVGSAVEDTIWLTKHWTNRNSLEGMDEWLTFPDEHEALALVRDRRNSCALQASNVPQLSGTGT